MSNFNTPYDDSFRTLLNDCGRLVIPLVNELFHETHSTEANVTLYQNEVFIIAGKDKKRITDSNFSVGENAKRYNIECQSSADGTIIVRIFEYASQIAILTSESTATETTFKMPQSGVLLLRHGKKSPQEYTITMKSPSGESLSYKVPVLRIKDYSLEAIFEKKLWFLIPFYFFNYELENMDENKEEIEQMQVTYRNIWCRLDELVDNRIITEYEKSAIKAMCAKVATALTENHKNVKEGVDTVMGGQILEYEAKTIAREASIKTIIRFGKRYGHNETDIIANIQDDCGFTYEEAKEAYDSYDSDFNN